MTDARIHTGYYDCRGPVAKECPDCIRITNPGSFHVNVQEAITGAVSDSRSKLLIKMFNFINAGERAGGGMPGSAL